MRLYPGFAFLLATLSLFLLIVMGGCARKAPGCATAEEVLPRQLAAIKRGDREEIGRASCRERV